MKIVYKDPVRASRLYVEIVTAVYLVFLGAFSAKGMGYGASLSDSFFDAARKLFYIAAFCAVIGWALIPKTPAVWALIAIPVAFHIGVGILFLVRGEGNILIALPEYVNRLVAEPFQMIEAFAAYRGPIGDATLGLFP